MLIIRFKARQVGCGRCLQQKLAEARRSWAENLNLGLTTTINELLIGFVSSPRQRHRDWLRKLNSRARIVPGVGGMGEVLGCQAARRHGRLIRKKLGTTPQISASARSSFRWKANTTKPAISSKVPAKIRPIAILACPPMIESQSPGASRKVARQSSAAGQGRVA